MVKDVEHLKYIFVGFFVSYFQVFISLLIKWQFCDSDV